MRPRLLAGVGVLSLLVAGVGESVPAAAVPAPLPQTSDGLLSAHEASILAAATGEPQVATEYTTERDLFTVVPGKGLVAEMNVNPVRVKQGDEWVDVDTSLRARGDGRLAPVATVADLTISGDGEGSLVEMAAPGGEVLELSWPEQYGDLPAPRVEGDLAVFDSVWPAIDLVVRSGVQSFSTYLVVHTPEAAQRPEVRDLAFDFSVEGAELGIDEDGRIQAVNDAGKVVMVSDRPEVWDAGETVPEEGDTASDVLRELVDRPVDARAADIGMEVDPADGMAARSLSDGQSDQLRLRTPTDFLEDPAVRFPIVVDPDVTVPDEARRWAMVWSKGDDWFGSPDSLRARVGYDGWTDDAALRKVSRMYYQFPIDQFDGVNLQITDATFLHKMVHSPEWSCDTSGAPSVKVYRTAGYGEGISWGNQPELMGLQDESTIRSGHEKYCDPRDQEWKVDTGLRNAKAQDWPRYTLMMKSDSETNQDGWREYRPPSFGYPKLIVTYNRAPSVTADRWAGNSTTDHHVWYDGAGWVRTRTPVLASESVDPDGDSVKAHFEVRNSAGTVIVNRGTALHESGGSPEMITLKTSEITADGTYTWRSRGVDEHGFEGPWSGWTTMKVDTTRPPAPTITAPRLASYGTGVSLTLDAQGANSGDVRYYRYGFLTSATPSTKGPTSLGAAVSVTRTGHMGPDWITATASDVAGNTSTKAVAKFKVMGASTSHQWHLDGNGNDEKTESTAPLATVGGPGWVLGHDHDYDPVGSGATVWAAGDKALSLNGSSQFAKTSGENANVINPDKGFALSAWVKLDPSAADGGAFTVASMGLSDTSAKRVALEYRTRRWNLAVRTGSASSNGWMSVSGPSGSIERYAGKWVHLVGVYEKVPSRLRLYINGIEASSSVTVPAAAGDAPTIDQPSTETLMPVWVGAGAGSTPDAYLKGVVDEVRAYSGPLDPTGAYLVSREVRNTP